jgi:hypothetical protein
MLSNKTSRVSLMARATARLAEVRTHLSATPWITTVGRGRREAARGALRRGTRRGVAAQAVVVERPLSEEDHGLDDHRTGIPVDPAVTRNFAEA